jgi:hypothetical protein
MLMFDRKIQKNSGSVRVTTSEFVLSVSKSIDLCKLKVDPEWGQRNLFSKRLLGSQNTAYWNQVSFCCLPNLSGSSPRLSSLLCFRWYHVQFVTTAFILHIALRPAQILPAYKAL